MASYLNDAPQVLDVGSLRVQDLLHHPVNICFGSLTLSRLLCIWAHFRLWMFCHCLFTAMPPPLPPSAISLIFILAPQLPGRHQLQPDCPGVLIWDPGVTVGRGNKGGAASQRAMAVTGGGRGGGRAVANRPVGAVQGRVHAAGRAVAQGGVVESRVAEAAGRYVDGAQDRARVRNLRKRGQNIRQVVIIV